MNTQFRKIILISCVIILILFAGYWYFLKTPKKPSNKELNILQQIFKGSVIISLEKEGQYEIEGDEKTETDVLGQSVIRKKIVNIRLLDLNRDGRDEIVAFTTLTFLGPVCTSCRSRLYINVLDKTKEGYIIKNEREFRGLDGKLFNSDITIEKAQLIDVNNDGVEEIQIIYKADSYFGLDKTKVTILQQLNAEFRIIWQQVVHFNMDEYSMFSEEDKQNYDATFSFEPTDGEYPNIIVEKTISKEGGTTLIPERNEQLIYKWDTEKQEYYLWKEEKIEEE